MGAGTPATQPRRPRILLWTHAGATVMAVSIPGANSCSLVACYSHAWPRACPASGCAARNATSNSFIGGKWPLGGMQLEFHWHKSVVGFCSISSPFPAPIASLSLPLYLARRQNSLGQNDQNLLATHLRWIHCCCGLFAVALGLPPLGGAQPSSSHLANNLSGCLSLPQILQMKIRRLEHLLHLKNVRIDDLSRRLQQAEQKRQ